MYCVYLYVCAHTCEDVRSFGHNKPALDGTDYECPNRIFTFLSSTAHVCGFLFIYVIGPLPYRLKRSCCKSYQSFDISTHSRLSSDLSSEATTFRLWTNVSRFKLFDQSTALHCIDVHPLALGARLRSVLVLFAKSVRRSISDVLNWLIRRTSDERDLLQPLGLKLSLQFLVSVLLFPNVLLKWCGFLLSFASGVGCHRSILKISGR